MSCKMEFNADDGITLKNLKLKYLSTKKDKYDNEFAYYSILNDNVKNIAMKINSSDKTPYFMGEKNFILKVKSRYITDEQKISGNFTAKMKYYNYNEITGYYINELINEGV